MADQPELMCFKPMSHRGDEKPADLFLVNKRGTLVPMCEACYSQFEETCKGIKADKASTDDSAAPAMHKEWLAKPDAERKVTLGDGMEEFLKQEAARAAGEREGPSMTADE